MPWRSRSLSGPISPPAIFASFIPAAVWVGGNFAGREMLVTLEFDEAAGGTELRLTHELLPDAAARDLHRQGWSGCLDSLVEYL